MADLWPATLPQVFQEDGYSESPDDVVVPSGVDEGPDIARRRSTAQPAQVTGQLLLDASQYATLRSFYESHTVTRFQWKDPRGATRYYRFLRPPKYTARAQYYRVQLTLREFQSEFGGA